MAVDLWEPRRTWGLLRDKLQLTLSGAREIRGRATVEHLLSLGHDRIAYVSTSPAHEPQTPTGRADHQAARRMIAMPTAPPRPGCAAGAAVGRAQLRGCGLPTGRTRPAIAAAESAQGEG